MADYDRVAKKVGRSTPSSRKGILTALHTLGALSIITFLAIACFYGYAIHKINSFGELSEQSVIAIADEKAYLDRQVSPKFTRGSSDEINNVGKMKGDNSNSISKKLELKAADFVSSKTEEIKAVAQKLLQPVTPSSPIVLVKEKDGSATFSTLNVNKDATPNLPISAGTKTYSYELESGLPKNEASTQSTKTAVLETPKIGSTEDISYPQPEMSVAAPTIILVIIIVMLYSMCSN